MSLICSIMVVCIHVLKRTQTRGSCAWILRQLSGEGLCRIAVPFFFITAGYFLATHFHEKGWYKREITKCIKSLVAPFIVWSFICFLVCSCIIIVENISKGKIWHSGLYSWHRLFSSLGVNPLEVPELRQLWFIRVLFTLVIISPILRFILDKLENMFKRGILAIFWAF